MPDYSTSETFSFAEDWTVPEGVDEVFIEANGETAGTVGSFVDEADGGYAEGLLPVTPGETLHIRFTEGGDAGEQGGRAADVRRSGTNLEDRVIVGAGSGAGGVNGDGGDGPGRGGGLEGEDSVSMGGEGGTQTEGGDGGLSGSGSGSDGEFGFGGNGGDSDAGGGGAGWYGGGGGAPGGALSNSGGGGSSYTGGVQNGSTTTGGTKDANGSIVIYYDVEPDPPENVTAQTNDGGGVLLEWTDGNFTDDEVEVHRSTSSGVSTWGTPIATVAAGVEEYTDTSVDEGRRYYYRLVANNGGERSDDSAEVDAVSYLPAPALESVETEGFGVVVELTLNSVDEDEVVVESDAGDGFADRESFAAGSESIVTEETLHGTEQSVRVSARTADASASSAGSDPITTDLPLVAGLQLDNGVVDEIGVSHDETINNGVYETEFQQTGDSTWMGVSDRNPSDTSTVIAGLLDGEEYAVRVRASTEYVTTDWVSATIVTAFPGAEQLEIVGVDESSISIAWVENADNEDGQLILRADERDPIRDRTLGEFEVVDDLPPDVESYTDDGLDDNRRYRYIVRPYTEYAEADSNEAEATTDVDYPDEGWFVVLEDDAGDLATIGQNAIAENRPRLEPEDSAKGRWQIDLAPEPALREWLSGETYIYYGGELWFRGPFTRYHPDGGSGSHAQLEGLDILEYLDRGGLEFSVESEPGYEAVARFADSELDEWDVDVQPPSENIIDDGFVVQDSTDSFGEPDDTDAWDASEDGPVPLIGAYHIDPRDASGTFGLTDSSEGGSDDYVGGFAALLSDEGDNISTSVGLEYTIPEEHVGVAIREGADDAPETEWRINGTVVNQVNSGVGLSFGWADTSGGQYDGPGYDGGDLSGTVDIDIDVTDAAAGDQLVVDWILVYDQRYFERGEFPDETDSNEQLPGPPVYPTVEIETEAFNQEFNVVKATATGGFSDTSGDQRIQVRNAEVEVWLPDDGSETNTSSVTADFAAAESFGTTARARVRLGGHGSRTDATPTEGFEPQQLSDWELAITTNALRVIDDQTYRGSPFGILDSVADDAGLSFVADYREDQLALEAFEPGALVEDLREEWTVVDDDPVDTVEGYFNTVTVWGAENDDGERLQVTASSNAEIERRGEIPAGDDVDRDRPEATTEPELVSIARSLLARGIRQDRITGSLEIEAQMLTPGYAYRVDAFEALEDDDVEEPVYVLQDASFEWGTMQLDFEARNSLARAIRSIETNVRTTKRAL